MTRGPMPADQLALVAAQFRVLAEPARLRILMALGEGEMTVTRLREATGLAQANLSKHLQVLRAGNFVRRRRGGPFMYYRVTDRDAFQLCDMMSGRLARGGDDDLLVRGA